MRRSLRASITIFALLLSLLIVPAAGAAPGDDNSDAAKRCQEGGFANFVRSDGTAFKNTGDCVSYVTQGGELKPKATLAFTQAGNQQTLTGTGLQPGSVVTYSVTGPNDETITGILPGSTVAANGTISVTNFTSCGFTNLIATGTTSTGGTISSAPSATQPCP